MTEVIIYKPTKTVMQSGLSKNKYWYIRFVSKCTKYIEPLMGWTATNDIQQQIRLVFFSLEQAVTYAKVNKWQYNVIQDNKTYVKPKSYTKNFLKKFTQ